MEKPVYVWKSARLLKPWITAGMILSLAVIGIGGCGSQNASSATSAAAKQSTAASQDTSETQSSASNQANQGQTAQKPAQNPAIEAAMGIRRLQSNQQMALTSDQKAKIKPILQLLIDTTNPSQDFLQEKANAITALFTDQQKTYLSTNPQKGNSKEAPNGDNQAKPQEPPTDQKSASNGANRDPASRSQDIFKQALQSLT